MHVMNSGMLVSKATALVTGAASGLGRATAARLLRQVSQSESLTAINLPRFDKIWSQSIEILPACHLPGGPPFRFRRLTRCVRCRGAEW